MTDAFDRPTTVVVVGSSHDVRALAGLLSDDYDVTFVSDRPELVSGASADGLDAHEAPLDDGSAIAALGLKADAAIVAATSDRVNLFVAQHLRTRGDISQIVVRVNDPDREDVFDGLGAETICSTDVLAPEIRSALADS